jgi:transglutaminase-like putative cysteine protease
VRKVAALARSRCHNRPVRIRILYETTYEYDRPVRFSLHHLRVIPRGDAFTQLLSLHFETQPHATTRFSRDAFDNVVASFSFADAAEKLELKMSADVEVRRKNPFDFILDAVAVDVPFAYEREFSSFLRVFERRQSRGVIALPGWSAPDPQSRRDTVQTLVELTRAIHEAIQYERREEGRARSPAETLRRKCGACRDVAVLLAEILRSLGLAARIVSGYLREADDTIHRAERSLHAWTEVFLPGAGWVGLDPTNGIFCDHNFIATAVGVRPAHVTPISGNFYHHERIPARMSSRVELINLSPGNVE